MCGWGRRGSVRISLSGLLFDACGAADVAAAARASGYVGVELRGTRRQLPPDAAADRVRRLQDLFAGLEVANIASHAGNFALVDADGARRERESVRKYLAWAARLGAGSVRVWPGWVAAAEAEPGHWERAARHLRWCAEAAADRGVMVAVEMHHATLAESPQGAARLLDAVDRPAIGLILDPANLMQTPAPFGAAAVGPIWDRLLHVHVKDHAIVTSAHPAAYPFRDYLRHIGTWVARMEGPRRRLGPGWFAKRALGQGHVPWPAILAELRRRHYAGHLIVESEVGPGMPEGSELARREYQTLRRWLDAL